MCSHCKEPVLETTQRGYHAHLSYLEWEEKEAKKKIVEINQEKMALTNKIQEDQECLELHRMTKKFVGDLDNAVSAYLTSVGACNMILSHFLNYIELESLPRDIQYYCAYIINQFFTIKMGAKGKAWAADIEAHNYFESGHLDDKFATIVKQLYMICKEEKLL